MWAFLSTLAGGLIALLASVSTTYYVQQQAVKAERRARATRAADDILSAVSALRDLPEEPRIGPPGSPETRRYTEWYDQKIALAYRIQTQVLLIPTPDLRERLTFVAQAVLREHDLETFQGLRERGSRFALCREALNCLGAYYRGEPLPPELPIVPRARAAIEEGNALPERQPGK
jgi:hypothetical protein